VLWLRDRALLRLLLNRALLLLLLGRRLLSLWLLLLRLLPGRGGRRIGLLVFGLRRQE
jgi:hypothetical protein